MFLSMEDEDLHHLASAYLFISSAVSVTSHLASHQLSLCYDSLHTMLFFTPGPLILLCALFSKHILSPSNYNTISFREHAVIAPPHLTPAELDGCPLGSQSAQCIALSVHLWNYFIMFCSFVRLPLYTFEVFPRQCLCAIFFLLVSPEPTTVPGPL